MTPNFTTQELSCPCCHVCKVRQSSANRLQRLRDILNRPVVVDSAYRCPKHNAEVGGAPHSKHCEGIAFDVRCSPAQRYEMIKAAFEAGFTCIIVYATWLHIDDRDGPGMFLIKKGA